MAADVACSECILFENISIFRKVGVIQVYRVQSPYILSPYEDRRILLWPNMDLLSRVPVDQSLIPRKSCIINIIHSSQIYSYSYEYD